MAKKLTFLVTVKVDEKDSVSLIRDWIRLVLTEKSLKVTVKSFHRNNGAK